MDKAAYFEALHSLDEDSDDGSFTDLDIPISNVPYTDLYLRGKHEQAQLGPKSPRLLQRSMSEPTLNSPSSTHAVEESPLITIKTRLRHGLPKSPLSDEACCVRETPIRPQPIHGVEHRPLRTTSAPTPPKHPSLPHQAPSVTGLGKRKRKEPSIRLVPEQQRIFDGLVFFYIPPDDIAPVRKARIVKAREYGATWARGWSEGITHIIAEKHLSYTDIISFLKIASIPDHIILVNELYPLDCIQFKAILNPDQKQYLLKGYEPRSKNAPIRTPPQLASSPASAQSLKLKAARPKLGRWNYVPPRSTPPRVESSGERSSMPVVTRRTNDLGRNLELEEAVVFGTMDDEDTTGNFDKANTIESQRRAKEPASLADALDEIIKSAREVQHLPLDEDDEDMSPQSSVQNESDNFPDHKHLSRRSNFNQESFSCMKGGTSDSSTLNPNARTISILQEMADYYARMDDTWRTIGYRKAITTLKQQSTRISTATEASRLPGIGQRIASKIEEIVVTDRLQRLDNAKTEPSDRILQLFLGIYGVGMAQASTWMQQGYSTLEDLLANADLSENQRLGITHYEDFQTRIPRAEVSALGKIITDTADGIDADVDVIIGGSYRRGAESCGDIDILLTKPETSSCIELTPCLYKLVSQLRSLGLLVAPLAVGKSESSSKWHGCCVLPGQDPPIWRRIDFHLAPATELGAALIYFTGNDIFNRSIRLLASKRGMRLNQKGLYKSVMRGPGRMKLNDGELVEGADEKRIFAELGVPWRSPEERIC